MNEQPKNAKVFLREAMYEILKKSYLYLKVRMILQIGGACGNEELFNIKR